MQINTSRRAWGIAVVLAAGSALLGSTGCDPEAADAGGGADAAAEQAGVARSGVAARKAKPKAKAEDSATIEGLSILSWNMEHFPLSDSTSNLVEEVLEPMAPDVVSVQEIEDDDAFLAMVGSMPGYSAVIADDPSAYMRVGMIYNEARVEVSEVETLFRGDRHAFPRPPLKAHVAVKGTDLDFDFVAVHLKAMGDPKSKSRRKAASEALERWIDERLAGGADPDVVVAGDFNDQIVETDEENAFQVFLDDPSRYHFLTQEIADAGDFSYIPRPSLIDHVLVTTSVLAPYGGGATEALHLEDSVHGYVHDVSDHRPVRVRFGGP